jgi:hypothetical protein
MTQENEEPRGNESGARDQNVDLAQFDDDFGKTEVEEREIPDGKYQAVIDRVEITRSHTTGNPMIKWALKILGPRFRGRLLWRNNVLKSRENLKWVKSDLHVCGLDIVKLSDLQANLPKLLGVKLEVTKRTRGEMANVYFDRRIVTEKEGGEAADASYNEALTAF